MTAAERQRLARILGMLGSEHAGERASAGLQAEAFRKRHGLTWPELLALPPVEAMPQGPKPSPPPTPEPPPMRPRRATPWPTAPPPSRKTRARHRLRSSDAYEQMKAIALVVAWISLPILLVIFT
jgi:hypothetical protein